MIYKFKNGADNGAYTLWKTIIIIIMASITRIILIEPYKQNLKLKYTRNAFVGRVICCN